MTIDTDNYNAQELSMFFEELSKKLKTKKQYSDSNPISRKGLDKRLKSVYSPQHYSLCGITLIEDLVIEQKIRTEEKPLSLHKLKDTYPNIF